MDQAIKESRRHLCIAEHRWPFAEGKVCGDDDRGAPDRDRVGRRTSPGDASGDRDAPAPVHVRSFFECPAALTQPDIERTTSNRSGPLLMQSQDYLIEGDVLFLFDHADDEVLVSIEARATASTLFRRRQPTSPRAGNPGDGR